MTQRPRLSASAVRDYQFCGRLYHFRKILKVQPTGKTPLYLVAGNLVHAAYYYAHANPVKRGFRMEWELTGAYHPDRAARMLKALWDDTDRELVGTEKVHWTMLMADKTPWSEIYITTGQLKVLKDPNEKVRKKGWGDYFSEMLDDALRVKLPGPVKEIERRVEYAVGNVPMLGFIDLVCSAEDGTEVYVDIKTGQQKPTEKKLAYDTQQQCYWLDGPSAIYLWHFRSGLYPVVKNIEFIAGLTRSVPMIADMVEAGIFLARHDQECESCQFRVQCIGESGDAA